jgi:hypothetical protein
MLKYNISDILVGYPFLMTFFFCCRYTKQGSLKDHTDCAPNNGYYFLPLYDKGEYVLKVRQVNKDLNFCDWYAESNKCTAMSAK